MSGKGSKWRQTNFKKYRSCELWENLNSKCKCGGRYVETSIFDDMDGVLHCDKCGKEIERHPK